MDHRPPSRVPAVIDGSASLSASARSDSKSIVVPGICGWSGSIRAVELTPAQYAPASIQYLSPSACAPAGSAARHAVAASPESASVAVLGMAGPDRLARGWRARAGRAIGVCHQNAPQNGLGEG